MSSEEKIQSGNFNSETFESITLYRFDIKHDLKHSYESLILQNWQPSTVEVT